MIDWTKADIEVNGFVGWVQFVELTRVRPPDDPGVYIVWRSDSSPVQYLLESVGGWFKSLDPTVPVEVLSENWIDGTCVVYIGKATNLRVRLGQYRRFGDGKPAAHQGGRYIWQLANSSELLVAWRTTADEAPQAVESRLIAEFRSAHGDRRPFANLKD